MVPLSAFAKYAPGHTPLSINHQGQFAASTISFNLAPGRSLSEAKTEIDNAIQRIDMPSSVRGAFAGTAATFQQSQSSMPLLFGAALVTIYIVLGVLYESLIHPITILSTLFSASVGAALALWLFDTQFTVIAAIGVLLLIGIVKKNAILMVDFALEAERAGRDTREAIEEACLLRFRPIMMTTFAALFGALPLAFGTGEGSELRHPLGITIVGGLIVSQVLTLYTTPVVFLYLDNFGKWLKGLWRRYYLRAGPAPMAARGSSHQRAKTGLPRSQARRDRTSLGHKVPFRFARTSHRHCPEEFWRRREREFAGPAEDLARLPARWPPQAPADDRRSSEASGSSRRQWDPRCGDDAPQRCASVVWRRASASMALAPQPRRAGQMR